MAPALGRRGRGRRTSHDRSAHYTLTEIADQLGVNQPAVESAIGEILELNLRGHGVEGAVRQSENLDLSQAHVSAHLLSLIRVLASDDLLLPGLP